LPTIDPCACIDVDCALDLRVADPTECSVIVSIATRPAKKAREPEPRQNRPRNPENPHRSIRSRHVLITRDPSRYQRAPRDCPQSRWGRNTLLSDRQSKENPHISGTPMHCHPIPPSRTGDPSGIYGETLNAPHTIVCTSKLRNHQPAHRPGPQHSLRSPHSWRSTLPLALIRRPKADPQGSPGAGPLPVDRSVHCQNRRIPTATGRPLSEGVARAAH
jgi:hypothetical protein